MDTSTPSEAVDPTFFMVHEVDEVVFVLKLHGVEEGPLPIPRGDTDEPISIAYGGGKEVVPAGLGENTSLETPLPL